MTRTIMLAPVGSGVGVTSVSLGLIRAIERSGVNVSFFKPIAQARPHSHLPSHSSEIVRVSGSIQPPEPFPLTYAQSCLKNGQKDVLLEEIVARYSAHLNESGAKVMIIEGLIASEQYPFANQLNFEVAKALDADIVFVTHQGQDTPEAIQEKLELVCQNYGGPSNKNIVGSIINKVGAPLPEDVNTLLDTEQLALTSDPQSESALEQLLSKSVFKVLGMIPWNPRLQKPRAIDLARHLNAMVLNAGDIENRRLDGVSFCAREIHNMVEHFRPGRLLVASGDRSDVIVSACLAAMNGVKIGALLLTGGYNPDPAIESLCKDAMKTGLPIMLINSNTWETAVNLRHFDIDIPLDDAERIEFVQDFSASHLNPEWIASLTDKLERSRLLSPAAFRYQLTERAKKAAKRIVLPEGEEPRTVKAASISAQRGIATPVLLGDPEKIRQVAAQQGIELSDRVEIIDTTQMRDKYVTRLVELRKGKGMTEVLAKEQLQDNVVLGTMMLESNEVDGLVSGAVHTTANTIRPPLQIIKTDPNSSLVSSVFFMLLPEQVYVYGDCAINPVPTAEQLAEIALQSANSALAFGIEPRVAMISYSTGSSGSGEDVEKVRKATELAKAKRPDLMIDGPLQYDAAVMENVARSKAPDSPVAGRANVFIFPDLNTGNTTYKAVQRSADLISIGPMLQGMRKPVNDLSRGALVDDIVYTIALTAIQADNPKT